MNKRKICIVLLLSLSLAGCNVRGDASAGGSEAKTGQMAESTVTEENTGLETGGLTGNDHENIILDLEEADEELQFITDAGKTASGREIMPVPDNAAFRMIGDINAGFNIGNAFDATNCGPYEDELDFEMAWCGAKTNEAFIDSLKNEGFNLVRIPVSWHDHMDENYIISKRWLERVTEVVDYCLDNDMYVIIDVHHDVHPNSFYPDSEHLDNTLAFTEIVWGQLAENFKDRDYKLIFECINEPRLTGTGNEWWYSTENETILDSYKVIMEAEQAFVDTVRETGGYNANRYLLIGGYCNMYSSVISDNFALPMDTAFNKLMVSVHTYSPYDFALDVNGSTEFDSNAERENERLFYSLYNKFVANGVPVIITEYGCIDKKNPEDRLAYFKFMRDMSDVYSIPLVVWDNNVFNTTDKPRDASLGFVYRANGNVVYQDLVDAMTGK